MLLVDVESRLCIHDPRNPLYDSLHEDDQERRDPGVDCWCDNCFSGRHALAEEILRLRLDALSLRTDLMFKENDDA